MHSTSTNTIIGKGNINASLFLIPQAPGGKEDQQNKMFLGPSGMIFIELIQNAGISWNDFYISNLIKSMLPNSQQYAMEKSGQYHPDYILPDGSLVSQLQV